MNVPFSIKLWDIGANSTPNSISNLFVRNASVALIFVSQANLVSNFEQTVNSIINWRSAILKKSSDINNNSNLFSSRKNHQLNVMAVITNDKMVSETPKFKANPEEDACSNESTDLVQSQLINQIYDHLYENGEKRLPIEFLEISCQLQVTKFVSSLVLEQIEESMGVEAVPSPKKRQIIESTPPETVQIKCSVFRFKLHTNKQVKIHLQTLMSKFNSPMKQPNNYGPFKDLSTSIENQLATMRSSLIVSCKSESESLPESKTISLHLTDLIHHDKSDFSSPSPAKRRLYQFNLPEIDSTVNESSNDLESI